MDCRAGADGAVLRLLLDILYEGVAGKEVQSARLERNDGCVGERQGLMQRKAYSHRSGAGSLIRERESCCPAQLRK